jgi:sn-glycerol 3-phosphate transport system permease protein
VIAGRGVEADLVQLPVLPRGLQSIPRSLVEAAAIDGAGPGGASGRSSFRCSRRRRSSCSSSTSYTLLRDLRHHRRVDQGGPGKDTSTLVYRSTTTASRRSTSAARRRSRSVLMAIVIALTVIQFRFVEKKVSYQ